MERWGARVEPAMKCATSASLCWHTQCCACVAFSTAGFPGRAREQQHSTRVVVPARVAHVLRQAPQLAAPAVEAFHYRDVDDMRVRGQGGPLWQ